MRNKLITLKSFIQQNRFIAPEHCFEITFADFEQIMISNKWKKQND